MLRKEWQYYASKARKIAKHIKTGAEENRDGTRWSKIIDVQDINATAALNKKFAKDGSRASVHTYWGGKQEIATTHTDGSKGLFQTNGECQSTNNPMDIEVAQYMNNSKNESKNMNKKLIKLTESDLHRIVKESVNRILKEDDSTPNIYNNRSMFAKLMYQTMSKMHDINETLFYNVLNGRINQFKILSNEEKDRLVEIAEMANKLNGNIAYLSEMLESQSSSQFEHEPEDWYERNEHGDFDTY